MDGEAYLRQLAEAWLQEIGRAPDRERELVSGFRLQEIEAAGRALVAADTITRERLSVVLAELRKLLIERGIIREIRTSSETVSATAVAEPINGATPSKAWESALEGATPELVRIVPVVKNLGPVNDSGRVLLMSLEVWSDRFGLRFASTRPEPTEPGGLRRVGSLRWEAWDDLGTSYRHSGGGGSGGRPWIIYTANFFPSIPPDASELSVTAKPFGSDDELVTATIALT